MPRHPRVHSKDILYHIIARGNNKKNIYIDDIDYNVFISTTQNIKQKHCFKIYAYCLMPNHFHLLIQVNDVTTSKIMQSILTGYAKYFNRKYNQTGHLFQGRYKAIICDRDSYLLGLTRYIHLNPVRAGICDLPEKWKWSGHAEYLNKSQERLIDPDILTDMLGKDEKGYRSYKEFIKDGLGIKNDKAIYPQESNPFLGTSIFMSKIKHKTDSIYNKAGNIHNFIELETRRMGIEKEIILGKSRSREISKYRKEIIKKAIEMGYSQSELSKLLGKSDAYISRILKSLIS